MTNRRQLGILAAAVSATILSTRASGNAAALECGPGKALDRSLVEAWLAAYGDAWVQRDSAKAASLFSPDARYHENVFEDVMVGQEAIKAYWENVTADQRDVKYASELWTVSENVAVAHWKAEFTSASANKLARLDGIFHLTFQPPSHGKLICGQLLEWWFFKM